MVFFDNEFLQQYLDQKAPLQVFVDSEYYDITDASDVQNPTYGVGYTLNGKPHIFDYRAVSQIKVAGNILTLDQLQSKASGEEPANAGAPEGGETARDGAPQNATAGTGGEAGLDAALKGGGNVPPSATGAPAPEDEEEDEPPQESARRVVGNMIRERKEKENTCAAGFTKGDFVENVDLKCEYHGSRGVVTSVDMPTEKNGIASVEYRIFNYGFNFKPGQKVVKLANELLKIGNE